MEAFVGIDLAIAKRKRLPVALCAWKGNRLLPFELGSHSAPEPPRGKGNVATLHPATVDAFAGDVLAYLHRLENHFRVSIRRIAIDAPSAPRRESLGRRQAEVALDGNKISCFATPNVAEFKAIHDKVRSHLERGGGESNLPHANQLWMLAGFKLFERLGEEWECIEVFPQATMKVLGAASVHKSKAVGVSSQLEAVARCTGWPDSQTQEPLHALKRAVCGPAHDGIDAYASAWIAALDSSEREALGAPPDDAIWVPRKS
jgi:hypothetical protein